jgi:GT2 family glycosyltransferase/glycosyltransferase involved in cell wall biosynthesis
MASPRPAVSIILHGHRWPVAAAVAALRARVHDALPDAEIIETREDPARALGAAYLMNAAAFGASGGTLVFVEPSLLPSVEDLRAVVAAASDAQCVVVGMKSSNPLPYPSPWSQGEGFQFGGALPGSAVRDSSEARGAGDESAAGADLLSRLADDVARHAADLRGAPAPHAFVEQRTPVLALSRGAFDTLTGLDDRLWSVGIADDLIARAGLAGVTVRYVDIAPEVVAPPAYPLRPEIARLLAIRNALLIAFKTASADDLGETLARVAMRAIVESWRGTGLSTEVFAFGGSWGRKTAGSLRQRLTGRGGLEAPLADAEACLLPLLAIDSALDVLSAIPLDPQPSAIDERNAWQRIARAGHHAEAEAVPLTPTLSPQAGRGSRPLPDTPSVSVVVVNWNGKTHLRDCFGSLQRSDYPVDKLELICVDNGSTDGSVDLLRAEFPRVKVVALDRNRGFTGGNEAGVREATGDVLVFLNNDMRVEPDCLRELVGALDADCSCAGARVLSWDGSAIDFIRGSLNFEGRGFQDSYGLPNLPELATPAETFFPNGGAFAVTRDAYDRAGGFDPAFFAYYDDVDLGWRLRLTGTSIRVVGRAVVYHRHGATSRTQPRGQKRFLMDRNAFWTLMKSYGESALRRTLGPALVLAIRRILDESTLDTRAPLSQTLAPFVVRCRKRSAPKVWPARTVYDDAQAEPHAASPVRSLPLEALGALCAAVEALPSLAATRAQVQARRTVDDRAVLPRFGRTLELVSPFSSYRRIQQALMEAEELSEVFRARTRLLIIGHEALARHMSGPAVRVFEMGKALSSVARVTIATPGVTEVDHARCTFATYDPNEPSGLRRLAEDADVFLVQGFTLVKFPFLKAMHLPVIVDLYCPFTLEHLEQTRARLAGGADPQGERLAAVQRDAAGVLGVQNEQLIDGDFFICASEAQRDFWIGTLHAQGRINPLTYGDDPSLRRLIDVVPFGLPEMPIEEAAARATASSGATRVMKGVWPGIGLNDRVLLWAGSLLDWQDPLTLIRAVAQLSRTRADIKLVFMGTRHPNPLVSPMKVVEESRALASQLGVLDTHVFFNDWVPYEQRALFLRDADLGLSTHREHLETHFSFRTRMLDYLWAGLPIVCTRGDHFATLVDERGLGAVVPPGDVGALAQAIDTLLDDSDAGRARRDAVQANIANIREEMRWSRVVSPLARYCAQPYLAADHAPALREFRERLAQQYGGAKWVKQTVLRLGLSEYQFERLKQSKLGRAAMSLQTRRAMQRARRGS